MPARVARGGQPRRPGVVRQGADRGLRRGRRHQPVGDPGDRRPGRHHRAGQGMGVAEAARGCIPRRYDNLDGSRPSIPTTDADEILRLTSRHEFPWDYQQGTAIAFMRDYGVPSIARLLDRTGEFEHHGVKRYDDTLLIGDEATIDGHRLTARARRGAPAQPDPRPLRHPRTTSSPTCSPPRSSARCAGSTQYGWRPLDPHELVAIARFTTQVRRADGDPRAADDVRRLSAAAARLRAERFAFDPANTRLAEAVDQDRRAIAPLPLQAAGPPGDASR